MTVDELETWHERCFQRGSTIAAVMRTAFMGDRLAAEVVSMNRPPVEPHTYSFACVAAGTYTHAGPLALATDTGTAQRWLFLPVGDPTLPADARDLP